MKQGVAVLAEYCTAAYAPLHYTVFSRSRECLAALWSLCPVSCTLRAFPRPASLFGASATAGVLLLLIMAELPPRVRRIVTTLEQGRSLVLSDAPIEPIAPPAGSHETQFSVRRLRAPLHLSLSALDSRCGARSTVRARPRAGRMASRP